MKRPCPAGIQIDKVTELFAPNIVWAGFLHRNRHNLSCAVVTH